MGLTLSPVGLDLGMDLGIAVALGGGGLEIAGAVFARQVRGVDGAGGADEEGFGAEPCVVDGTGGRCEVEDEVYRAGIEGVQMSCCRNSNAALAGQMGEIGLVCRCERLSTPRTVLPWASSASVEMRAEETGGSGNKELSGRHHESIS